jgi:hypothetical protein
VAVVAAVAGFAAVVTVGVAVAGRGGDPRPQAGAPAVGVPSPSSSAPGATPPPGGDATGAPEPRGGAVYRRLQLPAGDAMSLRTDPPTVQSGVYSGDFGFTQDATAFAVDAGRGTLLLVAATTPDAGATCRSGGSTAPADPAAPATSVATTALSDGAQLCVRSVDGTLAALVTFRQLPVSQKAPTAAVFDLTVWRGTLDRAAPGEQFRANFDERVARGGPSRVN